MLVSFDFKKYAFLVILLILAEAGAAAFIFFDQSWKDVSILFGACLGN